MSDEIKSEREPSYQNTDDFLRRGGPSTVTSSNWGGGEGDIKRSYPNLPFGGYFMSPGELKQAGVAGFSEWGYHPNIRTNVFGRSSTPAKKPAKGLDNLWSSQHVPKMSGDTLAGEHQRVMEWILKRMGTMRG